MIGYLCLKSDRSPCLAGRPSWLNDRSPWLAGQSIADFTRVKCDVNTPPALPCQGGVQRETPTARRWGVGLSNGVSHSMENRYRALQVFYSLATCGI